MPQIISSLNELGVDLAYDNISFSPLFFTPLMKIDNPQLYSLDANDYWKLQFSDIRAYPQLGDSRKLRLNFSLSGEAVFNNELYSLELAQALTELQYSTEGFAELLIQAKDINLKGFAKTAQLSLLVQKSNLQSANKDAALPSFSAALEFKDVNINTAANSPLSPHLKLFHLQADAIGELPWRDGLLTSLENWSKSGGFVDIKNMVLQWKPLTLVGRGNLKLNSALLPNISLNTSSKGLLRLLDDLQDLGIIDAKNVYVTKILLSNKAYRLSPDDDELTITTPISYTDGKISIENLVIRDPNQQTLPQ